MCPTSNKTLLSSETNTDAHTNASFLAVVSSKALIEAMATSCEKLFKKAFDIITPTS